MTRGLLRIRERSMVSSDRATNTPEGAPPAGGGRRRPGWRLWGGIGLAILSVAGAASYLAGQAAMQARLMRADPDAIVQDAALAAFATAQAQPVYDQHCASCHGNQMQGDRSRGAPGFSG